MSTVVQVERKVFIVPAVILATESLSAPVALRGYTVKAIIMPATGAWTAASLTFQMADKYDGTYEDVYDDAGNEVVVTTDVNRYIGLSTTKAEAVAGVSYLKVRSGTSGAAVAQAANRILKLVCAVSTK